MPPPHLQDLVKRLYALVSEFEANFPGRPFTPDGHMVGSLGECLAAWAYDLELLPPSTRGKDALTPDGRAVEIKATQGSRVAFRSAPEHVLVLKLHRDGTFTEVYNGQGHRVAALFAHKPTPSNGQHAVSLSTLERLMEAVPDTERIPRRR